MGAVRLRPRVSGPVLDGPGVAELVGRPVSEVYGWARDGVCPAPINAGLTSNPRLWRWSRRLVEAWLAGRRVSS